LFWAADIVDGLQRAGAMPGEPILDILPGWPMLLQFFENLSAQLFRMAPFLPASAYAGMISNVVLRLILPYCFLRVLGIGLVHSGLTFRRWQITAPFLLIGLAAWISQGVSMKNIIVLGMVTLYPGLTEESFYRGWLQPLLRAWLRPGYTILLTAIVFGLLHLPEYIYVYYTDVLPLAFSNLGDVILVGVVWGYGVYRTRSVLPWAVYHALSDLVGF
jgi:membrane protease YdiL (CAAX protease family)